MFLKKCIPLKLVCLVKHIALGKNMEYLKKNHNRKCSLNGKNVAWMLRTPENYDSSVVCVFTGDDKISIQNK